MGSGLLCSFPMLLKRYNKMRNIGILSTSSIALRFIAAVRETGFGNITAVSSRTYEKAAEKAAEWNIPKAYGSHSELLSDTDTDIVYISPVNAEHYRWAKAALESGKHVICEKPCTTTEAKTRELFGIAREKGLFLMEAQKMLFLPAVIELKKAIDSGRLGNVQMASFVHTFDASYNNWMYDRAAGGGPLLSSGIYVIELLMYLFGCKVADIGGYCTFYDDSGVEEQYTVSGRMEKGVLFEFKNSTRALMKNGAVIWGDKGYAELPDYWKARRLTFNSRDGESETLEFPCEHELVYEVGHIADCLENGLTESPVVTGEFSAEAVSVLEKLRVIFDSQK